MITPSEMEDRSNIYPDIFKNIYQYDNSSSIKALPFTKAASATA